MRNWSNQACSRNTVGARHGRPPSWCVRRGLGVLTNVQLSFVEPDKPPTAPTNTFSQQQVFINVSLATNNAVDPSRRATLNGLSMTLGSLAKAAGPTFFSSVFAWSIDGESRRFPFDRHLAFYLLALG